MEDLFFLYTNPLPRKPLCMLEWLDIMHHMYCRLLQCSNGILGRGKGLFLKMYSREGVLYKHQLSNFLFLVQAIIERENKTTFESASKCLHFKTIFPCHSVNIKRPTSRTTCTNFVNFSAKISCQYL